MAILSETISAQRVKNRAERFFYTGMAAAILLTVIAGFSRTYHLRLMPLLHVQGLIFTSWIALFLIQTMLVATKRARAHMRLGIACAWAKLLALYKATL